MGRCSTTAPWPRPKVQASRATRIYNQDYQERIKQMTDRQGNTDAPRVEEREVRSSRASGYSPLEEERGTSWVSVVLGWLAALGAGLILSGIVGAVVGGILGVFGVQGEQSSDPSESVEVDGQKLETRRLWRES